MGELAHETRSHLKEIFVRGAAVWLQIPDLERERVPMKEPNTPEEKRSTRGRKGRAYIIKAEDSVDRSKNPPGGKTRKQSADPVENLTSVLSQKVVGQPAATKVIVPYIQMFQAG